MDYSQEYFTIENLGVGTNTLQIAKDNIPYYADGTSNGVDYYEGDPTGDADAAPAITIYYSFDKITWVPLGPTSTTALTVDFTDKIYLKANCTKWATQLDASKIWTSTNVIRCTDLHCFSGNIMSLVHGDNFVNDNTLTETYALAGIFYNNTTLVNINNLILSAEYPGPAVYIMMFYGCIRLTTLPETLFSCVKSLNNNCFRLMFVHCSGLTSVPKKLLPFKTVARYCYNGMFHGCSSLTTTPILPASTLVYGCYNGMFRLCTSLTKTPNLLATTLDYGCYHSMFRGCSSLTEVSDLPATILPERCYYAMFAECSSLQYPPKMHPVSIGTYSCSMMFNYCSSLLEPVTLPALSVGESGCRGMFQQCTNLQYFPALPATELSPWCYSWMFQECSSASNTISLPATVMKEECYHQMFCKCTSLQVAPELPATTLAKNCYLSLFYGCTSLMQAPKLKAQTIAEGAYQYMFYGCMNLNHIECQALDISATDATDEWAKSVMSTGTFVQHINMNSWTRGISGIPTGWNVLFVDENGTTFSSEVKTQHVFENAIVKDFKSLTVTPAHISSSEFKEFVEVVVMPYMPYIC